MILSYHKTVQKHLGLMLSLLISTVFFLAYFLVSIKLYDSHQTRGDLTAYAQGMWNTVHGNFMASTYNYSVHNYYDKEYREITEDNSNILGIHFNPILLAFIPIYSVFPSPETLLFIQALFTAMGGFIIYLIAQKYLNSTLFAVLIQTSYLLFFATVSATLNQFHAYTLALFFAPLLIFASYSKSNIFYIISLIAFLFVQENTSLIAFFFGIYLTGNQATRRRGLITVCLSLAYFILVIERIIPWLSPYQIYLFRSLYGNKLGGDIPNIILGSVTHPIIFIQSIFTRENIDYISHLLLGIFPFALFSPPMMIVAFTALAQNILSTSIALKTQTMHYESGAVAFLFYALILGLSFYLSHTSIGKTKIGIFLAILVMCITTGFSYKLFTSPRFNPTLLSLNLYTDRDQEMDSMISLIPEGVSVSTQDYLSAQLSNRVNLYQFPVYLDQVDYLLLSTSDAVWPLTVEEQQNFLTQLRSSKEHVVVKETANFVLFARSPRP